MPQLGPAEILVLLILALVVFGPNRLPELARQVGSAIRHLRHLQDQVRLELDEALDLDAGDGALPPPASPPGAPVALRPPTPARGPGGHAAPRRAPSRFRPPPASAPRRAAPPSPSRGTRAPSRHRPPAR